MSDKQLDRQQGDVLLYRITGIPKGAQPRKRTGPAVLAEGEVTGHAHRIRDAEKVNLFEKDGVLYLEVLEECDLTHEEHRTQTIEPGSYEIGIVKEVDPFSREVRDVAD